MSEIDFVITAPQHQAAKIAYDNKVRQTHGVLIDIVLAAKEYIVLSAPYLRDLATANPILNSALLGALKTGITLHIISTDESMELANIAQYKDFLVYLYKPNSSISEQDYQSHAKFFMSDGKQVYLGSANFTVAGLKYNLEMGIYGKGSLAKQVESFWQYLLSNGYLISRKI